MCFLWNFLFINSVILDNLVLKLIANSNDCLYLKNLVGSKIPKPNQTSSQNWDDNNLEKLTWETKFFFKMLIR